ncbi:hypothetical protein [Helicobacter sp. 23-1045]
MFRFAESNVKKLAIFFPKSALFAESNFKKSQNPPFFLPNPQNLKSKTPPNSQNPTLKPILRQNRPCVLHFALAWRLQVF